MNEKDAWRRERALRWSEERTVRLKSFVTILTDVSRWPCGKNQSRTWEREREREGGRGRERGEREREGEREGERREEKAWKA